MRGCQVRLVDDQKICFFQYLFVWPSLMWLHIIHLGLLISSGSKRLLNQEMSIEKGITCSYTPGIYAEGYIAFVFPSLLSVALVEFRVHAPGWGWRSKSRTPLKCVFYKSVLKMTQVSHCCPLGYLFSSPESKAHRWAYSIGRHLSSFRRQHFQTTSLKPWSWFLPNFT